MSKKAAFSFLALFCAGIATAFVASGALANRPDCPGNSCHGQTTTSTSSSTTTDATATPTPTPTPTTTTSATATPTPTPTPTTTTTTTTTSSSSGSADPSGVAMPIGDISGWHQVFADNFANTSVPLGTSCGGTSGFPHGLTKWDAYPYAWTGYPSWGTYCPERTTSIHDGTMDIWLHSESVGGTMKHLISAPVPKIAGAASWNGQLYGRYVIRFQEPSAFGMFHPSFLLWPNSNVWPRDGEIDFPEGDTNSQMAGFMHWQNATAGSQADGYYSGVPFYGPWHTAVIEWLPTRVTFILDGKVVGNSTDTTKIPNTPMHWVIQTNGNPSVTPDNTSQGHILIDWVAIYSRA